MYYTISEIAKKFNLTISTLRYYDNEGLFPNLERKSGVRMFQDHEIETIRVIECLKKSGLEIKLFVNHNVTYIILASTLLLIGAFIFTICEIKKNKKHNEK